MSKETFIESANKNGVSASYSGKKNTMFVKGENHLVERFIRMCNLKGKNNRPFSLAKG